MRYTLHTGPGLRQGIYRNPPIIYKTSGKLKTLEDVRYFQRRRRQALIYCVNLGSERRLNLCKQRQLKLRDYYEKKDLGKVIYKRFIEIPLIFSLIIGITLMLIGYIPSLRDTFPISAVRKSAQKNPITYQTVGISLSVVGILLMVGGVMCYKYNDTALWRIMACPKCHRVYSRKNKRFQYTEVIDNLSKDKDLPKMRDICTMCYTSACGKVNGTAGDIPLNQANTNDSILDV